MLKEATSTGQEDCTQDWRQRLTQLSPEDVLSSLRSVSPLAPSAYTEIIE